MSASNGNIPISPATIKESIDLHTKIDEINKIYDSMGVPINPFPSLNGDSLSRVAQQAGLKSVQEINEVLDKAKPWMEEFLRKSYHDEFAKEIGENRLSSEADAGVIRIIEASFPSAFKKE